MRRFLEKQKDKITAVVFCTTTSSDTEIYKRYITVSYTEIEPTNLESNLELWLVIQLFFPDDCVYTDCFHFTFPGISTKKKLLCLSFQQMLGMRMVRQ